MFLKSILKPLYLKVYLKFYNCKGVQKDSTYFEDASVHKDTQTLLGVFEEKLKPEGEVFGMLQVRVQFSNLSLQNRLNGTRYRNFLK